MDISKIENLPVKITVELGRRKIPIRDLLSLGNGAVLELDNIANNPLNFYVNGSLYGTCKIIQKEKDGKIIFGMQVVEILKKNKTGFKK